VYNTATLLMPKAKLFVVIVALIVLVFTLGCKKPSEKSLNASGQQQQQDPNAVVPPKLIKGVQAQFPQDLWSKAGTVLVAAVVGADGKIGDVKAIKSPHPELDPLAIDAVKQWQFEPARQAGKPVPFTITVNVQFQPPTKGQHGGSRAASPGKQE
jgi:TonB family protein